MARSGNQKQKILYLVQMLASHKDENHVLPMKEIVDVLEDKGIRAERKSIYDDMEVLREFGFPIKYSRKRPGGYYLDGAIPLNLEPAADTEKGNNSEAFEEISEKAAEGSVPNPEPVYEAWWNEGEEAREVKIVCPVELSGRISAYLHGPLERKDKKDGSVAITGYAVIGNEFYGWLTALGTDVRLSRPKKAVLEYREYLKEIVKKYKEK